MSRRAFFGHRPDGASGLFIAPPGGDAKLGALSTLVLNASNKKSQLILLGSITPSGGLVVLGLGQKPQVFLTSSWDFSGVTGHTLGTGPMRPSPMIGAGNRSTATINSGGISMTIACVTKTTYAIYSQVF